MKVRILMGLILVAILGLFTTNTVWADEIAPNNVELTFTVGLKSPSETIFEIINKTTAKTSSGKTVEILVTERGLEGKYKIEATPSLDPQNDSVVTLKLKVSELRDVYDNGKMERKYVTVIDETSPVKIGSTKYSSELLSGNNTIQVTVKTNVFNQ